MAKKKRRLRTRLLIAKRFQIRYIALILSLIFLTAIITGYTVYMTTWIMFGKKLAAVYPQIHLLEIIDSANKALLIRIFILVPFVAFIGLVFSNRIAGPLFTIKRFLHKVSVGNYSMKLKLREDDELHDLAEEINSLVVTLKEKRDERGKVKKELQKNIEAIKLQLKGVSKGDKEPIKSLLANMTAALDSLDK